MTTYTPTRATITVRSAAGEIVRQESRVVDHHTRHGAELAVYIAQGERGRTPEGEERTVTVRQLPGGVLDGGEWTARVTWGEINRHGNRAPFADLDAPEGR